MCPSSLALPFLLALSQADARTVSESDARTYANETGLLYFETSAKQNLNVVNVFEDVADRLPRATAPTPPSGGIVLDQTPPERPKKSACC